MTILSIGDLNREIHKRCSAMGLGVDCAADGLFSAEIAIISEAPGERERQLKQPMVGSSGKLFWDLLRPTGLNRRSVYISNVVKRQLRSVDDNKVTISKGEVEQYSQILRWELEQLPNLRFVIALGNYALEAITGLSGILHHRGSVYETQLTSISQGKVTPITVIAMLNPAAVIREPKWEVMFKFDIARLQRVLKGMYKEHSVEAIINPSYTEAMRYIEQMQDERLPVSLDIEVIAEETACVGLANNRHTGMCINFRDRERNIFSVREESDIRLRLQAFADEPSTRLVMQNGMFDSTWLAYKDRIMLGASYFDTMLAHHTLYPALPHNLGFLTSQYTEHPFYKDEGKSWKEGGDIDQFWRYNVKDCCITFAAYEAMQKELVTQGLDKFFFEHVMRLQPHLARMCVGGVLADVELKEQIKKETQAEVLRLKEQFYELVEEATDEPGYRPNPASSKQMAELYFRRLRLVGRGTSTDAKNRDRMRSHPRTPEVAKRMLSSLDDWSKENKFLTTYANMSVDSDNRIRCEYKQTGVVEAPGRLSSSGTLWGGGTNLQNQPGRAHKMFIADHGYGFSYFDLSQAEARVVGWKYDIHLWKEQFEQARIDGIYDAHRALASEMFRIPYDEVTKEDWDENGKPTIRYKAKRCRHGLNYRMGIDELAQQLGISYPEAEELWRTYHRITPELQVGWKATTEEVRKNRKLFNAYGRRWILLERFDDEALKSVVAFYPQSTIGDKVSRCIYLCESDPEWPRGKARLALNIHDALIALHTLDEGEAVRSIMKKHALEPINIVDIYGKSNELIIPADLKKSVSINGEPHRWSTLEKVK